VQDMGSLSLSNSIALDSPLQTPDALSQPNGQNSKFRELPQHKPKLPNQKLKLLGYGEFNHLTNILTLSITCGLKLPLNEWGLTREIFNFFKWEVK
jgi:hypothetical protein